MRMTRDEQRHAYERVSEALRRARQSRYPVVLVLGTGDQVSADQWLDFAEDNGLVALDMLECAEQPEFQRSASTWPTLVDWIREQAIAHGGVLVVDLDAIATRWGDGERWRLYKKLLKSETRRRDTGVAAPIVVLSSLALDYPLPDNARNWGVVVDLLT